MTIAIALVSSTSRADDASDAGAHDDPASHRGVVMMSNEDPNDTTNELPPTSMPNDTTSDPTPSEPAKVITKPPPPIQPYPLQIVLVDAASVAVFAGGFAYAESSPANTQAGADVAAAAALGWMVGAPRSQRSSSPAARKLAASFS